MKTTLDLPDDLMRATKIRAAERNQRLKDVVADALRAALATPQGDAGVTPRAGPDAGAVSSPAAQARQRFDALLAQLDRVPDRPDAVDPLAWDELGLPR